MFKPSKDELSQIVKTAGKGKAVITGVNQYSGTVKKAFTITPYSIKGEGQVIGEKDKMTGTGKITVKGKGNFAGSVKGTFIPKT